MGKGGGALTAWLKEFTALVFTQTIQAFIYAIIITIIVYGMGGSGSASTSTNDKHTAVGLMATFALLSVFKVEDLTKKIFGVADTKAGHGSALKSLMKLKFAADIGKNTLNNAGKFFGGIRKITKAGEDRAKIKRRLDEDMSDIQASRAAQAQRAGATGAAGAVGGAGSSIGATAGGGASVGDIDVSDITNSVPKANNSSQIDRQKTRAALRAYEDQLSDINKQRDEGIKDMLSSVAESVGAVYGSTLFGVIGAGGGDLDDTIAGIMAGAGAGDVIGKGTINALDRAYKFAERNVNQKERASQRELKAALGRYSDLINSSSYKEPTIDGM